MERIIEFYESGGLKQIGFKCNDEETGEWLGFYENGQQQYEAIGGRFDCLGICEKAKVILVNHWAEDGSQEVVNGCGTAFEYYHDNSVLVGEFDQGLLHGYYREYVSGNLVHEAPCHYGLQHGIERSWDNDGRLVELSQFQHGRRTGLSFHWDTIGNLSCVSKWVNGKEVNIHWWNEKGEQTVRNGVGYHQSAREISYFLFGRGTSFEMTLSEIGRDLAPSWMTRINIRYKKNG